MVIEWFVCYEQKLREYLRKQRDVEEAVEKYENVIRNRRLRKDVVRLK